MNPQKYLQEKSRTTLKVYLATINGLINNGCLIEDKNVKDCLKLIYTEVYNKENSTEFCD